MVVPEVLYGKTCRHGHCNLYLCQEKGGQGNPVSTKPVYSLSHNFCMFSADYFLH